VAKKTSKSSTGPSTAAMPYITGASSAIGDAVANNAGNLAGIGSTLTSQFNNYAGNMGAGLQPAQSYTSDVLGGKYLTGNPYLQGQIDTTANDVTDRVNSIFGAAGRTGSGAHTESLSRGLAEAENGLRYQDYSAERARQDSAVGQSIGLNQAGNANLGTLLQLGQGAAELPYLGANTLARGYGSLWGGATTSGQTPSTAQSIQQGLGTALQAAALFSDRRLKVNVRRVGTRDDGLGVYDYRYAWGGPVHRGVMADEVARVRPDALGPIAAGYRTVNYEALR
jgi:hypothetical protein